MQILNLSYSKWPLIAEQEELVNEAGFLNPTSPFSFPSPARKLPSLNQVSIKRFTANHYFTFLRTGGMEGKEERSCKNRNTEIPYCGINQNRKVNFSIPQFPAFPTTVLHDSGILFY